MYQFGINKGIKTWYVNSGYSRCFVYCISMCAGDEQETTLWTILVLVITLSALNNRHYLRTAVQFMQFTSSCNNYSKRSAFTFKLQQTVCFVLQLQQTVCFVLQLQQTVCFVLQLQQTVCFVLQLQQTVCFVLQLPVPLRDFLQLTAAAHFLSLQLRKYRLVQNPLDTRDKTLFIECQVPFAPPTPPGISLSVEFARRPLRLVGRVAQSV